jgi:hypothetical protein
VPVVCLIGLFESKCFFRLWSFSTLADPTGGQVKYVSGADAQGKGLAYVQSDGKAVLRVDSWTNLLLGEPRNSYVVPAKFMEVPTHLMPSSPYIIAFVSLPGRRSTIVSSLQTLPPCRPAALYGLVFGLLDPIGHMTEWLSLLRLPISNRR